MIRKINISAAERTFIVAALIAYNGEGDDIGLAGKFLAGRINHRFQNADPTDDGPEVTILSGKDRPWYF